jgi:hypothetical protein
VLQDLAAHDQLGAVAIRRQIVQIGDAKARGQGELGRAPSGDRDRGERDVAAAHREPVLCEHGAEEALAAADLVDLLRAALLREIQEAGQKPIDQEPGNRVARRVLGIEVAAGDRRIGGHGHLHRFGPLASSLASALIQIADSPTCHART